MFSGSLTDKRRVAKNTILLYVRMLFTMVVSLYTSRIVLATLGIDDFGIYNVIGGVIAIFSVLSGSLSSAISRFITFELGNGDKKKLNQVFCTSVNIQLIVSFIVLLISEIIGIWLVNTKLNIPDERMNAANWVLQCSIITFVINLISVPYNATIIAHEKMSAFAYISILEVSLKLLVVYLLYLTIFDKLIIYAILLMAVALIVRLVYGIYCKRHFEETSYSLIWERKLFKEMLGFSSWNFLGNICYILNTQGVNLLINIYFGVAINAARAVAVQVDGAIMGFVSSFMVALNPQITKSYASKNFQYMYMLLNQGTKFAFFIIFLLLVPFILETEVVLNLWLKEVPEYSALFLRMVLLSSLVRFSSNVLFHGITSTGKIKTYQIIESMLSVFVFPLTWLAYKLGGNAPVTYLFFTLLYLILFIIRIRFLKKLINFSVMKFVRETITPICIVAILAFIPPAFVMSMMSPSIYRLSIVFLTSLLSTTCIIYKWGLSDNERNFVLEKILFIIRKNR